MADKKKVTKGGKGKKKEEEVVKEVPKEPEFPDGPKTIVVGGWSEILSINAAIELCDVAVGDKVAIHSGVFEEKVVIGKDKIQLKGVTDKAKIVLAQGVVATSSESSLAGVTIHNGLVVEKGSITVTDCAVSGGKHGVTIHSFASPLVKACAIAEQQTAGVYCFPNSRGNVENCAITGTAATGTVGIFADASGTIFKKNVIRKQVTGTVLQNDCTGLVLEKNDIGDVRGTGVYCTLGSKPTLKQNIVHSCEYHGVLVDQAAAPTLDRNTVTSCVVTIKKGCTPNLRGNTFTGRVEDENTKINPSLSPVY